MSLSVSDACAVIGVVDPRTSAMANARLEIMRYIKALPAAVAIRCDGPVRNRSVRNRSQPRWLHARSSARPESQHLQVFDAKCFGLVAGQAELCRCKTDTRRFRGGQTGTGAR